MNNKLRILVTGGAGIIGRSVIRELKSLDKNVTIISLDNYSTGRIIGDSKTIDGVRYLNCDIVKPHRVPDDEHKIYGDTVVRRRTGRVFDNLLDCDLGQGKYKHNDRFKMGNPDAIFHCAGLDYVLDVAKNVDNFEEYQHTDLYPMDLFDANVVGTKNMLEFSIHGQNTGDVNRREYHKMKNCKYAQVFFINCKPNYNKYADEHKFTKSLAEEMCKFYHKQFNLNVGMFSFNDISIAEFCKKMVSHIGKDLKGKKYEF